MKLLFATNNAGKLAELRALVATLPLEVCGPGELGLGLEVEEDGATFADNARKKATAFTQASGLWSLADDSGLCVDALQGRPGVHSARYAEGSDQDRVSKLLAELEGIPENRRGASFFCALALASPEGQVILEEGRCEGRIASVATGAQGFGYDPVFFVPSLGKTFAQVSREEKAVHGHRGKAFRAMQPHLTRIVERSSR